MALIAVASPGGSPGVTTLCLAAAFSWSSRMLLVECGESSVLPGYFAGREPYRASVVEVAMTAARDLGAARVQLEEETVALDGDARQRLLLPGVADPRQALQIRESWPQIAEVLRTAGRTVIADVGALGLESVPYAILTAADAVVLVLRPTVRFVAMAGPRIEALSRGPLAAKPRFLLLIGEGPYPPKEISRALGGTPVLGIVPMLPRAAEILSDGAPRRTRWSARLQMASLLRAVDSLGADLWDRLRAAQYGEASIPDAGGPVGTAMPPQPVTPQRPLTSQSPIAPPPPVTPTSETPQPAMPPLPVTQPPNMLRPATPPASFGAVPDLHPTLDAGADKTTGGGR